MKIEDDIPEFLSGVLYRLEELESNILQMDWDSDYKKPEITEIQEVGIIEAIRRLSHPGRYGDLINIIPKEYGIPGTCHDVLLVVFYATKTYATGRTLTNGVGIKDFEKVISEAHQHVERCPITNGIIFWPLSTWHPFVWFRHKYEFRRLPVVLKLPGANPIRI